MPCGVGVLPAIMERFMAKVTTRAAVFNHNNQINHLKALRYWFKLLLALVGSFDFTSVRIFRTTERKRRYVGITRHLADNWNCMVIEIVCSAVNTKCNTCALAFYGAIKLALIVPSF